MNDVYNKEQGMNILMVGGGRFSGLIYAMFSHRYNFPGYIDDIYQKAYIEENYRVKYVGKSDDLKTLLNHYSDAIITVGSDGDNTTRRKYYEKTIVAGFRIPILIHDSATILDNCEIGEGTIIQINTVIHPKVKIGKNCVISTNAIIGHDSIIGDNVFIAPGVIINGSCIIGDDTFLGTGSIVIPKRKIGKNCVLGAGSCATKDISDHSKAVGLPSRIIHTEGNI